MGKTIKIYLNNDNKKPIPANAFIEAANKLLLLLKEIESSVSVDNKNRLNWVIDELGTGSAYAGFSAIAEQELTYSFEEIGRLAINGLQILEKDSKRPPYYSNSAIQYAKDLAVITSKRINKMAISVNDDIETFVTPVIIPNVDRILSIREEIGEIEGTLKMVTITGTPHCNLYDAVTGSAVQCNFGQEIIDEITKGFGRRVRISGVISYTADGYPKKLNDITDIYIFPSDEDLPSTNDMLSVNLNFTGGLSFEEFIERMRNREL